MTDEDNAPVQLYGDPFDSGFALAHEHHMAADYAAAYAVYEELLALAESLEDSPTYGSCARTCWPTSRASSSAPPIFPGLRTPSTALAPCSTASRRRRWGRGGVNCGWKWCCGH